MDKRERQAHRVAKTTFKHWRHYVMLQKARRVVREAVEQEATATATANGISTTDAAAAAVDETTRLLWPSAL
jgi:hypothetical protein